MSSGLQASLVGGEISPDCYARVDMARYLNSLRSCENWIIKPYGGAINRSGSRYIAETKTEGDRVRLIPFVFSASQSYVLEFGDYYARFFRNGIAINALESVTAYGFGTGAGVVKDFQLQCPAGDVTHPNEVTVYVAGVEQSATGSANLFTAPEDFSNAAWIKDSGATITANNWTPPGEAAVGDTVNWSA